MEQPQSRFKHVLPTVLIAGGAFIGGQVAPTVVPADWVQPGDSQQLNFADLRGTYDILERRFDGDLDKAKIMDGARAGLVAGAGDPYTQYLDAKAAKELTNELAGKLSGIGAELAIKNDRLTVMSPIEGAPAIKAGIRSGDIIAAIDGKDASGLRVDEAVSKIRGDKGTEVTLTIVRGGEAPKDVKIVREDINVPSIKWSMKPGGIGYIELDGFHQDTSAKIGQAAAELKAQGAQKIVLDMRNNPGGYLEAAVAVTSQFLPSGKVVVEQRHDGKSKEKLTTTGGGKLVGVPTVVLINEGSASASEIVAGALKGHGAAKLIGEKSFGKGSVQEVIKLGGGAELKVTVAHWFTPKGTGIDKQGIKPDIEVKQNREDFDAGRDPQLDRALAEAAK